jgi:hypothetical protein
MTESFVNLMREAFPNISPETSTKLHQLIRNKDRYLNWLFATSLLEHLSQGDVLDEVPFFVLKDEGKAQKHKLPVMILNNTCDLQQDNGAPRSKYTSIVPLLPCNKYLEPFKHKPNYERDLKENVITSKFYIAAPPGYNIDYVVDLSLICSIDTKFLYQAVQGGTLKKVASLSENGYYYFLAKLTLHLMRSESEKVNREDLISNNN